MGRNVGPMPMRSRFQAGQRGRTFGIEIVELDIHRRQAGLRMHYVKHVLT